MDAILHRRSPSDWQRFISSPLFYTTHQLYKILSATPATSVETSVRIVCISDTHNQHESTSPLPDGDILVHAGDLTQSGSEEELYKALEWLNAQQHPYKLFIAGNHDKALLNQAVTDKLREKYSNLHYLQNFGTTVTIRGRTLHVYGSPNTPRHGSWAFQYDRIQTENAESSLQWSHIPLETDVLVTHGPPAYHLDNNGSGCIALLHALWRVRPLLHVFGHIHAARGTECLYFDASQGAYERVCLGSGGWWDVLVILGATVRQWWNAGRKRGFPATVSVNASVLGGYRDELRRKAIVVDI
jgi:Icc-related predicted phosphoesterase